MFYEDTFIVVGHRVRNVTPIRIRYFTWDQWVSLNILIYARLAEHGIVLDPDDIPEEPEDTPEGSDEWKALQRDEMRLRLDL